MPVNNAWVKKISTNYGADLVGITSADYFIHAPQGTHPKDILPSCKSVIVLCCEFPKDSVNSDTITYTRIRNGMNQKMDNLATTVAEEIKSIGFESSVITAIGSKYIDGKYRGTISLKHAAALAGLGKIGKNTLLVNDEYGNMIWLSAVLTNISLTPDSLRSYSTCIEKCDLCITTCPAKALGNESISQLTCFNHTFKTINGHLEIQCWKCRQICPNHLGRANSD